MAVYEPHKLSTQLDRLFVSGRCSVEEMAKLLHAPPKLIRLLSKTEGVKIHPEFRFRIGEILSSYHRAFPETRPPSEYEFAQQRKLRLVTQIEESVVRAGTPRGVFEEDDAPPGLRVFKSVDSRGIWCERREIRADLVTRRTSPRIIKGMELLLDEVDPVVKALGAGDT